MTKRPRPTIEQIKEALQWWNGLKDAQHQAPVEQVRLVRAHNNLDSKRIIGADDIARYWLTHIQPKESI